MDNIKTINELIDRVEELIHYVKGGQEPEPDEEFWKDLEYEFRKDN